MVKAVTKRIVMEKSKNEICSKRNLASKRTVDKKKWRPQRGEEETQESLRLLLHRYNAKRNNIFRRKARSSVCVRKILWMINKRNTKESGTFNKFICVYSWALAFVCL